MTTETKSTHTHSFSVDTSCDCGVVLSAYVRGLVKLNAELLKAVEIAYACLRRPSYEREENRVVNILLNAIAKAEGK